ncbi:MAG: class I SAM-dependent methyltransferase [Rhodocyclales bacterium]|nr:class I SAM-dependent methyltransferase [Rhodocyclales bacterium]
MATPHDEHFWNSLGNYDEEIISIFKEAEAARPLIERILRHVGPDTVVADLGCGPGKLLPYLKDAKKVYAVDKSANMLAKARNVCGQANVEFIEASFADLALPELVDLAVAVSSVLPASLTDFNRLMAGIVAQMKLGATLVMLLPSFESQLYYSNLRLAWLIEGERKEESEAYRQITAMHAKYMNNLFGYIQGKTDFPIQKFWIADELSERIGSLNALSDTRIDRFEKPWSAFFPNEQKWIRAKPPCWMWLVTAKRQ